MKKSFLKMPLVMALCGLVFFSCSETEDNMGAPGQGQQTETTDSVQSISYEVGFSKDLYDFFDMELSYTNAQGEIVTERMTQDVQLTVTPTVRLDSVVLKVTGKPKENMPAINDTVLYKKDVRYEVAVYTSNSPSNGHASNNSMPIIGREWREYVSQERTLVSHVEKF